MKVFKGENSLKVFCYGNIITTKVVQGGEFPESFVFNLNFGTLSSSEIRRRKVSAELHRVEMQQDYEVTFENTTT